GGCATADAAEVCVGLADAAPCALDGMAGYCIGGACVISRCGDGFQDPGEVCDDGNQLFGDNCSGDCRSLEVCANGIVDPLRSEFCDDGNRLSGDSCTSTCSVEFLTWRDVGNISPLDRTGARMAMGP